MKRIYKDGDKTLACFGWGAIQVGIATDVDGQVMVHLHDVLRDNPVGSEYDKWERTPGETVVLGFNTKASLDVLANALKEARKLLKD